jgi:hypothetical protein
MFSGSGLFAGSGIFSRIPDLFRILYCLQDPGLSQNPGFLPDPGFSDGSWTFYKLGHFLSRTFAKQDIIQFNLRNFFFFFLGI